MTFKKEYGDWTDYRKLPDIQEVDFHWIGSEEEYMPYDEKMGEVYDYALDTLKSAQEEGREYVLFTHGSSTSRQGETTARSVIRDLMRSKEVTPYIIRSKSIQHYSVFVAAIRSSPKGRQSRQEELQSRQEKQRFHDARLKAEWSRLCDAHYKIVEKMINPEKREMAHYYPEWLKKGEDSQEKKNDKIANQIRNYEEQYKYQSSLFSE